MRTFVLSAVLFVAIVAATLAFYALQHPLSSFWIDVSLRPEVRQALESSAADQKALRRLDRGNEARYRTRFEELRRLRARIDVLELSRREMARRYELLLSALFAAVLVAAAGASIIRYQRNERRLQKMQVALGALSRGETAIRLRDRRRDPIGRIARMVEETSNLVAGQRRRLDSLEHLAAWQDAARRHAHEIRTPLTAARLEIDRLMAQTAAGASAPELQKTQQSVYEELDRIARFTREFSSFAVIAQPRLQEEDLVRLADEFCSTFANAWPSLTLRVEARGAIPLVPADRELLRRVFANLCSNAALAVDGSGTVTFALWQSDGVVAIDVSDDGRGIDPAILPRLFTPFATTRAVGEGIGLGLAISRKILLDQGGDLELLRTSPEGTVFRIVMGGTGGE
jgi:two-component system nitrogen regulation sensor histidine kinase NtrY